MLAGLSTGLHLGCILNSRKKSVVVCQAHKDPASSHQTIGRDLGVSSTSTKPLGWALCAKGWSSTLPG